MHKRLIYFFLLVLTFPGLFSSCVRSIEEPEEMQEPQNPGYHTVHFQATVSGGAGTRSTLDEYDHYVFERNDRLFVIDKEHVNNPSQALLYGFLQLVGGEGDTMALFDGDLMYFDSEDPHEPLTPPASMEVVATLVSADDLLHTYTVNNGRMTNAPAYPNYPTDQVAVEDANGTAFQNAVRKFSHFTGEATYGNPSFTLAQQSSFILFSITFDDDPANHAMYMPDGATLDIAFVNGGSTRTGTVVADTYGGSFVQAHFAMAFPANTQLSGATLTLTESGGSHVYSEPSIANVAALAANRYYTVTRMVVDEDFCIRPNAATTLTFKYPVQVKTGVAPYENFADCSAISLLAGQTVKVRSVGLKYNSGNGVLFTSSNSSAKCYIYGDIMSLAFTTGYDSKKTTVDAGAFEKLFAGTDYIDIPEGRPLYLSANTSDNCYKEMFLNCTSLTQAPQFTNPQDETFSASITQSAMEGMFHGCTNLLNAPELPATTIGASGYRDMFKGCSELRTVPELNASSIDAYSYSGMFEGCSHIIAAPELPATTVAAHCYDSMFKNCTGLLTGPSDLPMTSLAEGCYKYMFSGCSNLANAPAFPSSTMASAQECYYGMFLGCEMMNTVPTGWALPITDITTSSCREMFKGCYSLATVPALSSFSGNTISDSGCQEMFSGCREITNASGFSLASATSVGVSGCEAMFKDCVKLTTPPVLPTSASLNTRSYKQMFMSCKKLTAAPATTITSLTGTENCYEMFAGKLTINGFNPSLTDGCEALVDLSNFHLNATTLTKACYYGMFMGCSKMTTVPDGFLPAQNLAVACYMQMFMLCTKLSHVPSTLLPGATLQKGCYANMFRGCSSLVDPPDLMAIDPVPGCYFGIFRGCTSLTGMKCLIILNEDQQGKGRPSAIADTGFPTPDGIAAWSVTNAWTVFNKWLIDAKNVNTGPGLKYNSAMPTPDNVYTGDQVGKVPANWPRVGIPAPTS